MIMHDKMETDPSLQDELPSLQNELVVFAHGLASAPLVMVPLAGRLAKLGYQTRNWGYFSIRHSIEYHGRRLADLLRKLDETPDLNRVHLVTHSMGCIVARYALREFQPRKMSRMVMLAPPNRGSHVASLLAPYLGRLCKPLDQLRDNSDSFVNQLSGVERLQVGIIAAAWDTVVQPSSTRVDWQADHLTVRAMHTGMLFRAEVARQVHAFLRQGHFDADCHAPPKSASF
jgi:triacylglycerol esterase/lipase EstA (alpha/beta hydrolase family)